MIARVRRSLDEKDKGFTLIELLVVVIIIGILSAIAIPVFMNQRKKAVDASIKADLKNVATVVESFYTDNGVYPTLSYASSTRTVTLTSGSVTDTVKVSDKNVLYPGTPASGFCFNIVNPGGTDTTNGFFYSSTGGGVLAKGTTTCP